MILAILQARFSSSRLPGKVLKPILGKPMLLHQIERLKQSKMIDKLVVATSIDISDDSIEIMCRDNSIEVFRGSLDNVLDRFYRCAKHYGPEHIVRLTGDCPLADFQLIDKVIEKYLLTKNDYMSNFLIPTFPDGLDVEIFKLSALEKAWNYAKLPSEIEHVSVYIRNKLKSDENCNFRSAEDLSQFRWTVDEHEDFIFVKKIYEALYFDNPLFLTKDILNLLNKHPDLIRLNNKFIRNEGMIKSLKKDKESLNNV